MNILKNTIFGTFLFLVSFISIKSNILEKKSINQNKIANKRNFSGNWTYEFNSDNNELLNRTFELNLIESKNRLIGKYCAVARGGRKIDCDDESINNIVGVIKNNIAYVDFKGFYDLKAKGKAKLYYNKSGDLVWEIINSSGEYYAPKTAIFKNMNDLYILKSCENSRFKIQIEKKDLNYFYSILDKSKIILKGNAIINKNQIKLGKIVGTITNSKIIIQNYTDLKKDSNFTQCSEKFLSFEKQ